MMGLGAQELLILAVCCGGPLVAGLVGLGVFLVLMNKNKPARHDKPPPP